MMVFLINLVRDELSNMFNFSHLGFWSGNFFLIAPFPDHGLLVHFLRNLETV